MSPEYDLNDLKNKINALGSLDLRKACGKAGLRAYYYPGGRKAYYSTQELRDKLGLHVTQFSSARLRVAEFFAKRGRPVVQEGSKSEDFDTHEDNSEKGETVPPIVVKVDDSDTKAKAGEADDFARGLETLVRKIAQEGAANTLNEEGVKAIVKESLDGAKEELQRELLVPHRVQVITPKKVEMPEMLVHKQFEKLLKFASATGNGRWVNVWIAGPAGSGKTHACRQVAKALGVPFYTNGALDLEHKLMGYEDANGVYRTTPFHEAYSKPSVYLFDEVDRSDPNAVLPFDGALANGHCDFPGHPEGIARDPMCIVLAAGNTFGFGADSQYVGANRHDQAFIDRFVQLDWDYDEALERAVAGNDNVVSRVQTLRAKARAAGLKVVISPRASQAATALVEQGVSEDDAIKAAILTKLSAQDRKALEV